MSSPITKRRQRDEEGAIAVMFSILLAFLLCSLAAIAVDLGDLYQRKAETQSQADLAALSAAPFLATSQAAAQAKAEEYLLRNLKSGQDSTDHGTITFPSRYVMTVVTPHATVNYSFARVFGIDTGDVTSTATVGLGTPGATATLPFYAVQGSGCDYGSQSLSDPANGHAKTAAEMAGITLAQPTTNPSATSNASLVSTDPYQFDVGSTGTTTLTGDHLAQVGRVGFFRTTSETPNVFEEVVTVNTNNNTVTGVPVPTNVTNNPGVWWIRVYKTSGNIGWSPVAEAIPIRIGDGPIQCGNVSNVGNFGTLKLARSTGPATWIPDNIAVGLQSPLSLQVQTDNASKPLCVPGGPNVVYTATTGGGVTRYPNTNCVDTDTGLTAQVSTQGFITGTSSGYTGRLVRPTTTGVTGRQCGVGHTSSQRTMLGYALNDDTLTCFMSNPDTPLSTIASSSYSGGAALDPAIYNSPRFAYVPVFGVVPSGGSLHYGIVDVRPCFITSESNGSTYNAQTFFDGSSATTKNGLTIPVNKITSLQVFFFNKNALPSSGSATPGVILDPNGPLVPVLTD